MQALTRGDPTYLIPIVIGLGLLVAGLLTIFDDEAPPPDPEIAERVEGWVSAQADLVSAYETDGRLPFDDVLQAAADRYGHDWRWLAAIVQAESRFRPEAVSPGGARGLMQLTGPTAAALGVRDPHDPAQGIEAGARYLKQLREQVDVADADDARRLSLAAYNGGAGHVRDAQRLAKVQGWPSDTWEGVARALPLLEQPRYHKRAKFGYCRGSAIVVYVLKIEALAEALRQAR